MGMTERSKEQKSPETSYKYIRIYFTVQIFQISGEKMYYSIFLLWQLAHHSGQKIWKLKLYLTLWTGFRWIKDQI